MQRIGVVLDVAKARKFRAGENSVQEIKALNVLPKVDNAPKHHGAMPWRDLPAFYEELKTREAVAALALRFLILTASRTSEVLAANWQEIDFENAVWTIPAERMKAKREHQVPLCGEALEILDVSQPIAFKYFHQLEEKGFIVETTKGHLGGVGKGIVSEYRLTAYECNEQKPTKEFASWKPDKI